MENSEEGIIELNNKRISVFDLLTGQRYKIVARLDLNKREIDNYRGDSRQSVIIGKVKIMKIQIKKLLSFGLLVLFAACSGKSSLHSNIINALKEDLVKAQVETKDPCHSYPMVAIDSCRIGGYEVCYQELNSKFPRQEYTCGHGVTNYRNYLCSSDYEITEQDLEAVQCDWIEESNEEKACADYPMAAIDSCRTGGYEVCYQELNSKFPRQEYTCGHGVTNYRNYLCSSDYDITEQDLEAVQCDWISD